MSQYYAPLMSGRLPDYVDFMRLARQGQVLSGDLSLARMQRLASALRDTRGSVSVRLEFDLDERRKPILRTQIDAELVLECQRCLGNCSQSVSVGTLYGLIEHESQAERLPEHYEPLLLSEEPMSPLELVEDELILALPVVPRHEDGDPACQPYALREQEDVLTETTVEDNNPFAVLNRLKE